MEDIDIEVTPAAVEPEITVEPATEPATEPEEDIEQIRKDAKAFKDQKKRAEKAEDELKKLKGGSTEPLSTQAPNNAAFEQRITRAELAANGIKDRTEQDFVIGAAKRLGVDASEAASDPIVAARLDKMREDRKVKDATPAPSKGGGSHRNTGKLPDFSKMSNTEFDEWEKKNR